MHAKLEQQFKELESTKANYLLLFEELTEEKLNQAPEPGKWSMLEVVAHILSSESRSLGYLKKKMLGINEVKKARLKSSLGSGLLKVALRLPLKYKAPKVLDNPNGPYKPDEMIKEWEQVRVELKELLTKISDEHINKQIFKHPSAGKMNIVQAMGFLNLHLKRHLAQVRKVRATVIAN